MMGPAAQLLALAALIPAAANPSLLARAGSFTVSLCEGGSIDIPLGKELPGSSQTACCNKGCHSSEKRKRGEGSPANGDGNS